MTRSGYNRRNRNVLGRCLNIASESAEITCDGTEDCSRSWRRKPEKPVCWLKTGWTAVQQVGWRKSGWHVSDKHDDMYACHVWNWKINSPDTWLIVHINCCDKHVVYSRPRSRTNWWCRFHAAVTALGVSALHNAQNPLHTFPRRRGSRQVVGNKSL